MTADKSAPLVPKLRFPEFRDAPEWECLSLKILAKRITLRNVHGSKLRVLTNSAEYGVVDQREYFDREIATNTRNYFIVEQGDYVYNPRSSSAAPVGPVSKNLVGTGVMSPLYSVFRFRSGKNDFYAHYFKSSHWHEYLRQVSNHGARHDRMAITNDDLMQMPMPKPTQHEQQKIADCLGSLDDLIAAEDRKLEALRQHKQGLMQQLFPQPGKTTPQLRFPECSHCPEWEEKRLGDLLEVYYGRDHKNLKKGTVPVFGTGGIMRHVERALSKGPAILIGRKGTINKPRFVKGVFWTVDTLFYCIPDKTIEPRFLFLSVQQIDWQKYNEATGVPSLRADAIEGAKVAITPELSEQHRIADCLGSLDDLIAARDRKLEALRRHKKGLMQQLFPGLT